MTQNDLGVALTSLGERLGGAEGAGKLAEAAEACRRALEVITRHDLPMQWAATQDSLGDALASLGQRLGGAEGERKLAEAAEAYRHALEVLIRDDLPHKWAVTQNNLGRALQNCTIVSGFPASLKQIDQLSRDEVIRNDPVAAASLQTLAIACRIGMDQGAEAGRDFASLVALITRQPDDFRLVWDWKPLRDYLGRADAEAIKSHRAPLLKLIEAVSRENRGAILAGLKEVEGDFAGRAEEAKKEPRE